MTVFAPNRTPRLRLGLLPRVLSTADAEAEMIASDPVLRQAILDEQRIGRRIASVGRDTAVIIIALFLPFLNPDWSVLYYHALLALFWASGRLRARYARIGRSVPELALILFDILLLIYIAAVPNPFVVALVPTAFGFRWGTFQYLYLVLALAVLAYSWRTVWTVGVTAAGLWLAAVGLVALLGREMPDLADRAQAMAAGLGVDGVAPFFDLNDVQWSLRFQEAMVFVIVAGALMLKGWRSNQLLLRQARLAEERENLARYFAPTMVDRLASTRSDLLVPKSQEIAVMFVDLVGFTEFSEARGEAQVVGFLRGYYERIERIVFDHGGTLDKYLGDGVMATFGTPVPEPGDAANALRAARAVVAAVDAMGAGLRVSVGVHFGRAVVGDVGPSRRLEYAVLGDAVNVAARLEAATREVGARVVVSDALAARARAEGADMAGFVAHPGLALRGRAAPVDAWVLCDGAAARG
jgi:adenylate cyclase